MASFLDKESLVIGISGRSGSGKSTVVKSLLDYYGPEMISLHTMDNYYMPRHQQIKDDHAYLNFDLPTSFYRKQFYEDLKSLKTGKNIEVEEYVFNNERPSQTVVIPATPVILVEGLFIFYYDEVRAILDIKVIIDVPLNLAFERRLRRDLIERNYDQNEIAHRYHLHAEPAYQQYIKPFMNEADLVLPNHNHSDQALQDLCRHIEDV